MKKQELKLIIKPLIKECLKEVLIEEGFSKMLSESFSSSVKDASKSVAQPTRQKNNLEEILVKDNNSLRELQENRKKMLDSIGMGGFDPFHGTKALTENQAVNNAPTINPGMNSGDPGVDISNLLQNKNIWKQTLNAMKGKKDKE